jgi:hypothetical protein
MISQLFNWSMRHGAKLLFAFALLQFFLGLMAPLRELFSTTRIMAASHNSFPADDSWALQMSIALQALSGVSFPLLGALLINRCDIWIASLDRSPRA